MQLTEINISLSRKEMLVEAHRVLSVESKAIENLSDALDDSFCNAVELISKMREYLVVVGVGKSGHIARKIAASFASTGTPAFFVHPTEASHGDIGKLTPNTVILALSNSGESRELYDILLYATEHNIPVISMTRNEASTLGQHSNVVITIPQFEEACPNGTAPTTSTTCLLALGDALVVTTMQARGFSLDDFVLRHPGGSIGSRLQRVHSLLKRHKRYIPKIGVNASMRDTLKEMTKGRAGCVAVVSETTEFLGMITDRDTRSVLDSNQQSQFFDLVAGDVMNNNPYVLTENMVLLDVLTEFTRREFSSAFVINDNKAIGLVTINDIINPGVG